MTAGITAGPCLCLARGRQFPYITLSVLVLDFGLHHRVSFNQRSRLEEIASGGPGPISVKRPLAQLLYLNLERLSVCVPSIRGGEG